METEFVLTPATFDFPEEWLILCAEQCFGGPFLKMKASSAHTKDQKCLSHVVVTMSVEVSDSLPNAAVELTA